MRDTVPGFFIGIVLSIGLALAACGGGEPQRRDPEWRARERVPNVAEHWWWEPVEARLRRGRRLPAGRDLPEHAPRHLRTARAARARASARRRRAGHPASPEPLTSPTADEPNC
ncbi:MAG: hypothetical protein M5U28_45330 [Sandaracinaceae bacterium]|nr:hypothetical protein [Sandaracinaceae bacterium]